MRTDADRLYRRIQDLTPELRKRIFDAVLDEERQEQSFRGFFPRAMTDRRLPLDTLAWGPIKKRAPALLQANRELRREAGQYYYSKGQDIYLDWETSDPFVDLRRWANDVVGDLATYLRDVRVHITRCLQSTTMYNLEHEYTMEVKFVAGQGLRAEGFRGTYDEEGSEVGADAYGCLWELVDLPAYAAAVNGRRAQYGNGGNAIVGFLVDQPDELRDACFGPPVKWGWGIDRAGAVRWGLVHCARNDPNVYGRYW